jgi:NADH-quinone oxidoreductase subunit M
MNSSWAITVLTLVPLFGGLLVVGLPGERKRLARGLGLGISLATLVVAVWLWVRFDPRLGSLQFVQRVPWIPSLGVDYFVGLDGIGLTLVLLSALLVPFALIVSWGIEDRVPLYFALVLWVEAGLLGTFTALNFFHWFLFWELGLLPAFFLVRLWGGPGRGPAATQFFVYTMAGSAALLLAFLGLYLATGTFDFIELADLGRGQRLSAAVATNLAWPGLSAQALTRVLFLGVFFGFAVKVPVLPFHTWLPSTYAEAPTGTVMLLTGAMSKMGVYGLLRLVLPVFPDQLAALQTPLLWLAALTIVCGAAAAAAQRDLKRLLAYSSVNHLGYCALGIFVVAGRGGDPLRRAVEQAAALDGVLLQMFNHGLTAAALFCCVGWLERRNSGRRGLDDFGGVRRAAPVFCGLMGLAVFASLGLPGLNGFVGEFLIFKGAFALAPWAAVLAAPGLLITAVFLLTLLQRVFHGPLPPEREGFPDLSSGERWLLLPAVALMFLLGVYPQALVAVFNPTITDLVRRLTL